MILCELRITNGSFRYASHSFCIQLPGSLYISLILSPGLPHLLLCIHNMYSHV